MIVMKLKGKAIHKHLILTELAMLRVKDGDTLLAVPKLGAELLKKYPEHLVQEGELFDQVSWPDGARYELEASGQPVYEPKGKTEYQDPDHSTEAVIATNGNPGEAQEKGKRGRRKLGASAAAPAEVLPITPEPVPAEPPAPLPEAAISEAQPA